MSGKKIVIDIEQTPDNKYLLKFTNSKLIELKKKDFKYNGLSWTKYFSNKEDLYVELIEILKYYKVKESLIYSEFKDQRLLNIIKHFNLIFKESDI